MGDTAPSEPDPAQSWETDRAARWLAMADRLEAQLVPVDDVLFDAAAIEPGMVVLDVGCGRGVTTRRAAREVGPDGRVTAVDISEALIASAQALAPADAPIEWIVADAQRADLPVDRYDLVMSRFGVMFFDDLVEAFDRLRRATKPGGRLCLAVWQSRDRSEVMQRPIDVTVEAARSLGHVVEPVSPTAEAFGFGDLEVVRQVLGDAGWSGVRLAPHTLPMHLCGPGTVAEVVDASLAYGQVQRLLADAPDSVVASVRAALIDDLAHSHDGVGVQMGGAVAVVSAIRA
jgi:ubiquinone/menaquinone biosynthesis C-methylase UbiE